MDEQSTASSQGAGDKVVGPCKVLNQVFVVDIVDRDNEVLEACKQLEVERRPQHADDVGDGDYIHGRAIVQWEHAVGDASVAAGIAWRWNVPADPDLLWGYLVHGGENA